MKFCQFLISMLLLTIITQYFTQQEAKAYSHCPQYNSLVTSPQQLEKISYWTNYFFDRVRPEMRGKKIKLSQTIYRQEKTALRRVVRQVLLCSCERENINSELTNKDKLDSPKKNYFFDGFYDDLTDAIFYARHPEITNRESKLKDITLFTEWTFIRQYFLDFGHSEILTQEFVPACTSPNVDRG